MANRMVSEDGISLFREAIGNSPEKVTLKHMDMSCFRAFLVGGIRVTRTPAGDVRIELPEDATAKYYAEWKADVGGIFLNALKGSPDDICEVFCGKFKALAVRTEKAAGGRLSGGCLTIGDYAYVPVKIVPKRETYTYTTDYIRAHPTTSPDENAHRIDIKEVDGEKPVPADDIESVPLFNE